MKELIFATAAITAAALSPELARIGCWLASICKRLPAHGAPGNNNAGQSGRNEGKSYERLHTRRA